MSDDEAGVAVASTHDPAQRKQDQQSPISNVQNILGFLIAGFGGVLSFLGLRSTEITTVLRNDPAPVALISFTLLLGVLAAVLTVVIDSGTTTKVSWADAAGTALLLFGLAAVMIYAIPVSAGPSRLGLALTLTSAVLGVVILGISLLHKTRRATDAGAKEASIPLTAIFLIASVMLIAISTYGGMRLETASQLSSSAQVAATLNGSGSALSVHVAASKVDEGGYVWIAIEGLPVNVPETVNCPSIDSHLKPTQATCEEDPCGPSRLMTQCKWIMDGSIAPDSSGDVDNTINVPIQPGEFQDIDIRALVCTASSCAGPNPSSDLIPTEGSRIDVLIPTASPTSTPTARPAG